MKPLIDEELFKERVAENTKLLKQALFGCRIEGDIESFSDEELEVRYDEILEHLDVVYTDLKLVIKEKRKRGL